MRADRLDEKKLGRVAWTANSPRTTAAVLAWGDSKVFCPWALSAAIPSNAPTINSRKTPLITFGWCSRTVSPKVKALTSSPLPKRICHPNQAPDFEESTIWVYCEDQKHGKSRNTILCMELLTRKTHSQEDDRHHRTVSPMQAWKISGLFGLLDHGCPVLELILYSLSDIIKRRLPHDGRSLSLMNLGHWENKSFGSREHDDQEKKDNTRHIRKIQAFRRKKMNIILWERQLWSLVWKRKNEVHRMGTALERKRNIHYALFTGIGTRFTWNLAKAG